MADERLIPAGIRDASTLAFNELIDRLGTVPLDQLLVYLVDNVTAEALPHLAEQFHVTGLEGWSLCNTEDDRRSLIKRAIWLHRKKGTPRAVKEGLKSVGFGGATIDEQIATLRYDGAQIFSGDEIFGAGANWARFNINLDLGESRGVSTAETAMIRAVVDEWKNARSHLAAIVFSATVSDTDTITESATLTAIDGQADILPWGRRYDGSVTYSSGRALAFDGTDTYNGTTPYSYSIGGDLLHDNAWESDRIGAATVQIDTNTTTVRFDGMASYDGVFDQGATPPPMYDARMTVTTKRNYLFNGVRTYGSGKEYDGSKSYSGGTSFAPSMEYKGIHTIQEVTI